MKNRYLYRAKRTDNGGWVEGYYQKRVDVFEKDEHLIFRCKGYNTWEYAEIDPNTICQCTGLNDKNGKLIWENDILMCHGNGVDLVKAVYGEFYVINAETLEKIDSVIGWHYEVIPTDSLSKCEPFCLPMPLTEECVKTCELEVIGNVFDNSELIEQ